MGSVAHNIGKHQEASMRTPIHKLPKRVTLTTKSRNIDLYVPSGLRSAVPYLKLGVLVQLVMSLKTPSSVLGVLMYPFGLRFVVFFCFVCMFSFVRFILGDNQRAIKSNDAKR